MAKHFSDAEIDLIRNLASEFALANPSLAPLLDGNKTDPDVERLLDAVLFQNSLVRQRLDIAFPELIQQLTHLILPHYLRPIPASTIIGFTTHATKGQTATIPAGTQFASAPTNGPPCLFRTTADVELHPLELIDASLAQGSGKRWELHLSLAMKGLSLNSWQPNTVRFFLADEHTFAAELYLLLSRHVMRHS